MLAGDGVLDVTDITSHPNVQVRERRIKCTHSNLNLPSYAGDAMVWQMLKGTAAFNSTDEGFYIIFQLLS